MASETVKASELVEGDVVLTHGMRVRIFDRITRDYDGVMVYSFDGEILNGDEIPFDFIPRAFRGDDGKTWRVQSNDKVSWAREI